MQPQTQLFFDKPQAQVLLDKLSVIKLRQEALGPQEAFNVFRILRSGHEEVSLHSRFLYELLNPKGTHGMGDALLRHFVEICELPAISFDTVQVMKEHANIDLLIQDNIHAVVIENKIYAGDQPEQLLRYYNHAKNSYRQPTLVYLTLHGEAPSEQSAGNQLKQVKLISYKGEINTWITTCIKEAALKPVLRETLVQYQLLINQLTNNAMNEIETQDVLALMSQGNNAEQAAIISRNWNHVCWHTEWNFWTELLAHASASYKVSDDGRFSSDALDKLVWGGNNKDYSYGLAFPVGKLLGADVIFKIERGEPLVCYGFFHCASDSSARQRMTNSIHLLGTTANEWWAGYRNTKSGIDFSDFNTPVTLQLANPIKRHGLINELWTEIQNFIDQSSEALQQEFGTDFVSNANPSPRA